MRSPARYGSTASPSTWPQTGQATAAVLGLKKLREDENDQSPCLEDYRNKFVSFESFYVSQRDMLASILRVTGDKESDWKITQVDVETYYKKSIEDLQKGDRMSFGRAMYSSAFFQARSIRASRTVEITRNWDCRRRI